MWCINKIYTSKWARKVLGERKINNFRGNIEKCGAPHILHPIYNARQPMGREKSIISWGILKKCGALTKYTPQSGLEIPLGREKSIISGGILKRVVHHTFLYCRTLPISLLT